MGIRSIMSRSLAIAANFVFKLHVAALEAWSPSLRMYPVMDGVYVVSERQGPICDFLETVFSSLAHAFVSEPKMQHRFVAKSAVAYGPVVHGADVPREASRSLHGPKNPQYKDAILLGIPMVQAVQGESKAPPYGVYIHESARAFAPEDDEPFRYLWWHWFKPERGDLAKELRDQLDAYFKWCKKRSGMLEYDREHIQLHRRMAKEHFAGLE